MELCYISGNGILEKVLCISENGNIKKLFIFREMRLLSPSSKQ